MTTQMQDAKAGIITDEMEIIARKENIPVECIRDGVARGRIAILKNNKRQDTIPVAVGENLKVKVSACINTPNPKSTLDSELDKLRVVVNAPSDIVIDCSANKLIDETRAAILSSTKKPVGTYPITQVGIDSLQNSGDVAEITKLDIFSTIEKHCSDGVDFICVQCGLTKAILDQFKNQNVISKKMNHPALMLACQMLATGEENPLYEYFDELLELVKPYDVTLFLSSAFKSTNTQNASSGIEVMEQIVLGELVKRARENDVQVVVEGIEMASMNKIPMMVQNIKELTDFAPLYVTNAIACDAAAGHDNIASAIGGALAAYQGADILRAVCDVDRISYPSASQIREGVMSAKIAAHCADLARGHVDTIRQNYKIAYAQENSNYLKILENTLDKTVFDGIDKKTDLNLQNKCGFYSLDVLYEKYFK